MKDEEKQAIESVKGGIGSARTEGEKLEATYKLRDSIDQLQQSIVHLRESIINVMKYSVKSQEKQDKTNNSLQKWLIVWTAIMTIATIIQVIIYYYKH
jgi:chromosome segregation ATPase